MTKKNKLALIYSQTPSEWVSCQSITFNLKKTYEVAFPNWEICSFDFSPNKPQLHIWECAQKIFNFAPDFISIIDHKPHPRKLIQTLSDLYSNSTIPPLFVHLFGDFSLYAKEWIICQNFLKNTQTHFITASEKQRQFVSQFLLKGDDNISVFPFPVDEKYFYYDKNQRNEGRKILQLEENETAIIYTGRLSLQKNTLLLLQEIYSLKEKIKNSYQIYLIGPMDDLALPYFGIEFLDGHYYHLLNSFLDTTELDFRSRVHFLGPQSPDFLLKLLNAGDIFISLSQHNDEDYGMSPAEAICTGLPAILSHWGGYTSFALDKNVQTIPFVWEKNLELNQEGFKLDHEQFESMLLNFLENPSQPSNRLQHSLFYSKSFSISGQNEKLKKIIGKTIKPFSGFGPKMEIFSAIMSREAPFYFGEQSYDYYKDVYRPYFS